MILPALLALAPLAAGAGSSCRWRTVDVYTLVPEEGASASDVAVNPGGEVYVGGTTDDFSANSALYVRRSRDGGERWTTVLEFRYTAGRPTAEAGLAVDGDGNVFVAGSGKDVRNEDRGFIIKIAERGATWNIVDEIHAEGGYATAGALLAQVGGTLHAAAYLSKNGIFRWFLRKSVDSGTTWRAVEIGYPRAGISSLPVGIGRHGSALYIAGYRTDGSGAGGARWIVHKSTDGDSWRVADDWQLEFGGKSVATGVSVEAPGGVFVCGKAQDAAGLTRWIVRKSSDGGASWMVVDNFTPLPGSGAQANRVAVDNRGAVYVAGEAGASGKAGHWIVRRSADGGKSWETIDDYQLVPGKSCGAAALHGDAAGRMFVAGVCENGFGRRQAVVRRGWCPYELKKAPTASRN